MQKYVYIAVALIVGVAVAFALTGNVDAKALNVNEVGADPSAFSGTITVTGIMAGTSQTDGSVFGIMDIKELQCRSANCNKIFIPVQYNGKHPVVGDEVKVTGSFKKLDGGYIFTGQSIKVVKNHKIGG